MGGFWAGSWGIGGKSWFLVVFFGIALGFWVGKVPVDEGEKREDFGVFLCYDGGNCRRETKARQFFRDGNIFDVNCLVLWMF